MEIDAGSTIRALIVDDEPLARRKIHRFLQYEPDIEVIGECNRVTEAIRTIQSDVPDLLFLDIKMPGHDGFDLLDTLDEEQWPIVVFVTAYEEYAIRAFEVNALDYLLKPFDRDRFQKALSRARRQIEQQENQADRVLKLLEELQRNDHRPLRHLLVKSGEQLIPLRTDDIDWLEADGNYVRAHVGDKTYRFRDTLTHLEATLDSQMFIRIHRSYIVNVDRVISIEPYFHGDYVVILQDNHKLKMSRRYKSSLEDRLGAT